MLHTSAGPITVYYCKAGIQTGRTCRVSQTLTRDAHKSLEDLQGKSPRIGVWDCKGVKFHDVTAEMIHDNASGKAKRSGARCVLTITAGQVELIDEVKGK